MLYTGSEWDGLPYNRKTLRACPLCGCTLFNEFLGHEGQATAIYCTNCPYGVEDDNRTLEKLREIHNKRYEGELK